MTTRWVCSGCATGLDVRDVQGICDVVVCVGAVVAGNKVDVEVAWDVAVDEFEEQPFLVAVPRFVVGEDFSGCGVHGGEQGGGSVAFVVVGHRPCPPWCHR